jgi:hypothetical protein
LNRAVKRFLASNSLLTAMIKAIVAYNENARFRHFADSIRKALRNENKFADQSLPPYLVQAKTELTEYAFDLLMSQYSQALMYKAELKEGEADLYSVKRQVSGDVVLPDSDRHNDAYECSLDFGVHGSADVKKNGRVASLNGCSCQFPIVFKLPCRHMFTISIVCQRDVQFEFGVKWLRQSDAEERIMLGRLRMRTPSARAPAVISRESRQDRFSRIFDELRCMADFASDSRERTELLLRNLATFKEALSAGKDIQEHTELPTMAAPQTKDQESFEDCMGAIFEPDYDNVSRDPVQFNDAVKGHFVAFKWNDRNRGGWHAGRIDGVSESTGYALSISHPYSDKSSGDVNLDPVRFFDGVAAAQPKNSWVMLREKPLGHNVAHLAASGMLQNPVSKRGRPQTTRKRGPEGF